MLSRRRFIQLITCSTLAFSANLKSTIPSSATNKSTNHNQSPHNHFPQVGVHLPLWHQGGIAAEQFWDKTFDQLKAAHINHCLILNYYFVDPVTGRISKQSQYNSNRSPELSFLEKAMQLAKQRGIKASLYPVLEIDNPHQVGAIWRGNLNFFGVTLKNFFNAYNKLIIANAEISLKHQAPYIYLGSELASLTHNIAARPFWEQLLYDLHSISNTQKAKLTYAAHWEEYLTFPFWRQLDLIGINAYFPLAEAEQATGTGNPAIEQLQKKIMANFKVLKKFAINHQRPIHLSEFGLTPFDQTTTRPWQQSPSEIYDETERLKTYQSLFNCLKEEFNTKQNQPTLIKNQPWMSSVNFWHWKLPDRNGSPYNIAPQSKAAVIIKDYLNQR